MLFIDNKGITDPRINLAIEEYALKNLAEEESVNGDNISNGITE